MRNYFAALASGEKKGLGHSAVRLLLWPFAIIFMFVSRLRNFAFSIGLLKARKAPRPVVSIGNISSGGTGKTPLVLEIARMLKDKGVRPIVLSRGYG